MAGDEGCKRIVATRPGQRTGETVYLTEDGRRWTTSDIPMVSHGTGGTGVATGYVRDGRICEHAW